MGVPNALAYQRIIETDTAGFLVRQYMYSSLYDRLSTRPFLEDIEKKWLAFQLLCALRDCHARNVFHGDIKTENTLVTSWNWLYLSDFSAGFKPTLLPEDNPADFSYFFDTAGRRTCYLAPERFLAAGEPARPGAHVTWAMDVFSAGCVIAELFLETPIFTLSQLFRYRKGEYDPVAAHLHRVADPDVRELIAHMIHVDPESRYAAEEYLDFWRKKAFPEYFYGFLHQYLSNVTDPSTGRAPISGAATNLGEADDRIDQIWHDFDKIAYFLDYANPPSEVMRAVSGSRCLHLLPVHLNIPHHQHQATRLTRTSPDDGTLIFLTLVVSSLRHTARAQARLRACDLLLAFAERLTDEAKLDRVLPYLISLLSDEALLVRAAAIRTITQVMALVTVVTPVNAHVFPEYILPRMERFLPGSASESSPLVRATHAACLGSLASSAARFLDMATTLRTDGSLPSAGDAGIGAGLAAFEGLYDNARAEIVDMFGKHTKALITDSDSSVKRAFLGSVAELCMFFGTADSNDIILSHLNTYLNDRQWMLKCAFFETMVGVATFLGGTSLESFILPLMVQALTDPEEFVIQQVLQALADMAELGLFSRATTWELVDVVGRFTMHPNVWIREASAHFLSASTIFLSPADVQCIIAPSIRPYVKMPLQDLAELVLLDNLKKPISRSVLDMCLAWASKSQRSLFWRPTQQQRIFSGTLGNELGVTTLPKMNKNDEDEQWISKLRSIGLNPDEDFKLLVLRDYLWLLAPMRARQVGQQPVDKGKMIALRSLGVTPQTVMFSDIDPEPSRWRDSTDETVKAPHTITDALLDASMTLNDPMAKRRRSAMNTHLAKLHPHGKPAPITITTKGTHNASSPLATSPMSAFTPGTADSDMDSQSPRLSAGLDDEPFAGQPLSLRNKDHAHLLRHRSSAINLMNRKDSSKSIPETSTTSTNAFGRVEGRSPSQGRPSFSSTREELPLSLKPPTPKLAHDYAGTDPSIIKMLNSLAHANSAAPLAAFGPSITPSSRRRTIARSSTLAAAQYAEKSWRPDGSMMSTFAEHVGAIRHVVVAPDHAFFLTGGDDGCVRIWDTGRLERNIAHRSRQTYRLVSGAKVTALCFVENTHSFVVCGSDGSVHVVRVDTTTGSGVLRYGKLRVLRSYQLADDEFAVCATHFRAETTSTLLLATNVSRVLALDLRSLHLDIAYALTNPVRHGTPSALLVDRKRNWILLGTTYGVLDLWDLRFRIRLRAWGVPGGMTIKHLALHPTKGRGRWVCVASGAEVSVWDVEKVACREIYRLTSTGKHETTSTMEEAKRYTPRLMDEDGTTGLLNRFANAGALDNGAGHAHAHPHGNTIEAMCVGLDIVGEDSREGRHGFIITAGADRKVRFWDLARIENSRVVSGVDDGGMAGVGVGTASPGDARSSTSTFVVASAGVGLTIYAERPARNSSSGGGGGGGSKTTSQGKVRKQVDVEPPAPPKPPRSTVISLRQQQLLKSHLDAILGVALIESPYGMIVSVDRSGVVFVYQ